MSWDPIAKCVKRLPRTWQSVIVISGAFLVHISLGTFYTFGNMLPYIISYQKNNVSMHNSETWYTWLLTVQGSFQPIAGIFGGFLERHIGPRLTVHVGGLLMCGGVLATRWTIQNSFAALIATYGVMFGAGVGIAKNATIVCAMKWLPNNRGLASGLVLLGFGCGAFVFNPVQTHFINPLDYKPDCILFTAYFSDDGKKYFCQADLLDRVPSMFVILAACYGAVQLIGSAFQFNPDEENTVVEESRTQTEIVSITPRETLMSSTFYILSLTYFCTSQTTFFITALYKRFGEAHEELNDDNFLAWVGSASSIFNAIGRPFWGVLGDKYGYQVAMIGLTVSVGVLMLTLQITPLIGRVMFMIWAIAGVISSLLVETLISRIGYNGMFVLAAGFAIIGFILTAFIHKSKHGKEIMLKPSIVDNPDGDDISEEIKHTERLPTDE